MTVAFISDIHTDFYIPAKLSGHKLDAKMYEFIENELWLKDADVLVFAGDNSHYPQQNKLMLEKIAAKKMYKKIFVTFGNHDMYLVSNAQKSKFDTSWDKVMDLKAICDEIDTVEFLDGNIVEVDGVKFGGCGMWYDFSYAKQVFNMKHFDIMHKWKDTMNDANLIVGKDYPPEINDSRTTMYGGYGFKTYTFDPMKFYKQEEEKMLKIVEECDVFISHIGPLVPPSLPTHYQNAVTSFYYFNGEWILNKEKAPKLWIWGHTHDQYLWKHNNTVLACNPLGYKSENKQAEVEVLDLDDLPQY
jgi:predicted phosphodiesterase